MTSPLRQRRSRRPARHRRGSGAVRTAPTPASQIKKHPEWIKEAHDLGLKVNVWTVDKAEDMKWLIDQKVDFITTNEPTVAQEILK